MKVIRGVGFVACTAVETEGIPIRLVRARVSGGVIGPVGLREQT